MFVLDTVGNEIISSILKYVLLSLSYNKPPCNVHESTVSSCRNKGNCSRILKILTENSDK